MARLARIVAPGIPHLVLQRGNLLAQVFFSDDDRRFYLQMLAKCAGRAGLKTGVGEAFPRPVVGRMGGVLELGADGTRDFLDQMEHRDEPPDGVAGVCEATGAGDWPGANTIPGGRKPAADAGVIDLTGGYVWG